MKYKIGMAHQKKVRDLRAESDKQNLFSDYWKNLDKSLEKAVVREVDYVTARNMIEQYEWLGCMPAITLHCYGIYFDNTLGGVVAFSPEYIENLGRWDKYDYTGKIILLSRGVCVHWTPINTNSKLVMSAIKLLPEKYKIVTATTDHLAGEIGTIYQACNFDYVGSMRDANPNVSSRDGDREAFLVDGKLYGTRAMRQKFGTTSMNVIQKHYPQVKKVRQNSKHRYFLFRGTKKEKNYYRDKIKHLLKPYPKRDE